MCDYVHKIIHENLYMNMITTIQDLHDVLVKVYKNEAVDNRIEGRHTTVHHREGLTNTLK